MSKLSLKVLLGVFALMFVANVGLTAANYLCIPTKITGFYFENGNWDTTGIKANSKYVVSKDRLTVSEFGKNELIQEYCSTVGDTMYCDEYLGEFNINFKTLRYMRTAPYYDYIRGGKQGTPFIELGTCSKF